MAGSRAEAIMRAAPKYQRGDTAYADGAAIFRQRRCRAATMAGPFARWLIFSRPKMIRARSGASSYALGKSGHILKLPHYRYYVNLAAKRRDTAGASRISSASALIGAYRRLLYFGNEVVIYHLHLMHIFIFHSSFQIL